MEKATTTTKNFLSNLQESYLKTPGRRRWNAVANPLKLWPSIYDLKGWDEHPDLKLKRLGMWEFFAKELARLQITTSIDVGCASAQFTLLQRLQGIDAYGVDPQEPYLFSNSEDYERNLLDPKEYLFLGDLENIIKCLEEYPIQVDCISNLNFIHGWDSSDEECLNYFKSLSKAATYLIFSYPQQCPAAVNYINDITESVVAQYNAIGIPHETHCLIKIKK